MSLHAHPPIRFVFGVHLHQPVGNFDSVFEEHLRDVYRPLIEHVAARDFLPIVLHMSGPLLEWLERHAGDYLDRLGALAADGRLEFLLAGFYEPVLASLPRQDRLEQIAWMREALHARFGVHATGLWLTERVWEPELAADLHDAGVRYALVDDRHFLVSGFSREHLHAPWWTESGGKRLAIFPIDERLRYLIPFQPPADTVAYLRTLRESGHRLAVLADDGEKFGGWPGTKEWVYDRGWFARFFDAMGDAIAAGEVRLSTFAEALEEVPGDGPCYLSTASYREMEEWSLPPEQAVRLLALEKELGPERMAGAEGPLVRGSHWRNFQAKYAESNRMHKKMLALSSLCRERGDPPEARRAVGRGQCNDAYWHGVFGGLYLPHLRQAVWRELAHAERVLRAGESIAVDVLDLDFDGHPELWVHSAHVSVIVSPRRGGAIEELTHLATGENLADALMRRREAYHRLQAVTATDDGNDAHGANDEDGMPSIHDIEKRNMLTVLPPMDVEPRAVCVDRMLPPGLPRDVYERAEYAAIRSWARTPMTWTLEQSAGAVTIRLRDGDTLEKRITIGERGDVRVHWRWDGQAWPADASFAPELSLARDIPVHAPGAVETWRYPIETVAKSEKGLDRTVQGMSVTPLVRARAGEATVVLDAAGDAPQA
jgi:hypothetical protein